MSGAPPIDRDALRRIFADSAPRHLRAAYAAMASMAIECDRAARILRRLKPLEADVYAMRARKADWLMGLPED